MILQEFVKIKDKKLERALDKLNKKRAACKNNNGYPEPDCRCPYGGVDPKDCEDLCRLNHK